MNIRQAQLPEGWELKRLGEVCELKPPKKEARQKLKDNDQVSFLPMADLGVMDRTINVTKVKSLKDVAGNYTYFANNDVLLAKITPCFENGKLGIARNLVNGIGFGSSEYIVFRSKGGIYEEYLFYYLSQEKFRSEGRNNMTGAVGHKRVSIEFIENYKIPLPPFPEQQRIVSILDRVFAAIDQAKANAEKNLLNAKELFESYLQGVFDPSTRSGEGKGDGWEEKTLGEITTKIGSGATPRGGKSSYKNEGISLIRSMNIHDRIFKYKDLAFIDDKQADQLNTVTIYEGDVLLNITGASVARCAVVPIEVLPARVNQHVSIIRPVESIANSKFLNFLLTSRPIKDELLFIGSKGSTRQAINKSEIENFTICIPNLKEQLTIVQNIETIQAETQKLETLYQKKIAALDELKKSILQKAFQGQLSGSGFARLKDDEDYERATG